MSFDVPIAILAADSTSFRLARLKRDHSQQDAAREMGVSVSIVSKWEIGTRVPKQHLAKVERYIVEGVVRPLDLKKARALRGQTVREAALDLNIDPKVWGRWERGEGKPDPDVEQILCAYIIGARFLHTRGSEGGTA